MGRRVYFGFVGMSDYVPVRYEFGGRVSSEPEAFVQAAILDQLTVAGEPFEVRIGVTREVREAGRWDRLAERLALYGDRVRAVDIDLRDPNDPNARPEMDARWLWSLFDRLGAEFERGDEVHFDITHGFRSLPTVALLALTFFSRVRGFSVGGVYYGAFESLLNRSLPAPDGLFFKDLREIAAWCRGDVEKGPYVRAPATPAPIFNLTAMYALTEWTDGISEWKRTGRADGLVARTEPVTRALRTQLRQDAPMDLVSFPGAFAELSSALTSVRHDRFANKANEVIRRLDGLSGQTSADPSLTPLGALASALRDDVLPLTVPFHSSSDDWKGRQESSDLYLRHQCAVARWLGARRRVVEAYTVLRETITSCLVRVAVAAGLTEVHGKGPTASSYRDAVDGWALVCCGAVGEARVPSAGAAQSGCDAFCAFVTASSALPPRIVEADRCVREMRNRYDHAWTGEDHSRERDARHQIDSALTNFRTAADAVEALVAEVIGMDKGVPSDRSVQ